MNGDTGMRSYHVGVDLGQRKDHTAIVVVEQRVESTGVRDAATFEFVRVRKLVVVRVEQVRLGTRYSSIVDRVEQLSMALADLGTLTIAVDATGLGGVVTEDLRRRRLGGELLPVVFTGGNESRYADGFFPTPKTELMTGLMRAFEVEGLCVAEGVAEWGLLEEELMGMRKVTGRGGVRFVSAGKHDDLVMALSLALFGARRRRLPLEAGAILRRREAW